MFGTVKENLWRIGRVFVSSFAVALVWIGMPRADAQSAAPSHTADEMISWVVLSDTYVDLDVDLLRAKLAEIYPGQFLPPRDKGNFVVNGTVPGQFFVNANVPNAAGMFLVMSVPGLTRNSPAFKRTSQILYCVGGPRPKNVGCRSI